MFQTSLNLKLGTGALVHYITYQIMYITCIMQIKFKGKEEVKLILLMLVLKRDVRKPLLHYKWEKN